PVSLVFHTDGIPMMEFEWDCAACPADSDETDTEFFIPDVWFPYGWHAEFIEGRGRFREEPASHRLFVKTPEVCRCKIKVMAGKKS
ncbi:MAG: hypothetical protein K5930_06995, partial [Treponemataceae bacterium]|nr:hypothetical protein [Treponemataceae bacterium]